MSDPEPPKQPYWIRGPRTRHHIYYTPSSNLPGVLLFALIALLGALAVAVAVRHLLDTHVLVRKDAVLLSVGLFAFLLGGVQGVRLWREP